MKALQDTAPEGAIGAFLSAHPSNQNGTGFGIFGEFLTLVQSATAADARSKVKSYTCCLHASWSDQSPRLLDVLCSALNVHTLVSRVQQMKPSFYHKTKLCKQVRIQSWLLVLKVLQVCFGPSTKDAVSKWPSAFITIDFMQSIVNLLSAVVQINMTQGPGSGI